MSSREFTGWIEFYKLEPFGREADFQGHALVAATVYNVHRGKDDEPATVKDYMPKEPEPPQTPQQMLQFAKALTVALGGTVEER